MITEYGDKNNILFNFKKNTELTIDRLLQTKYKLCPDFSKIL